MFGLKLVVEMVVDVFQKGMQKRDFSGMVDECPRQCKPELGTREIAEEMFSRRIDARKPPIHCFENCIE